MLPDDALVTVIRLIHEHRPRLIVEAGSGRSTPVLAQAVKDEGVGRIVSLEHLPEFAQRTQAMLLSNRLEAHAQVRLAPLEPHEAGDWYANAAWADLDQIGMLIVDGPPGHTGPLAREPALWLLRHRFSPGAVIVLDDTNRPEEQTILRRWEALVPGLKFTTLPHSTGAISHGTLPTGAA